MTKISKIPDYYFSFRPVQPGCKIPSSPYSVQTCTPHLPNGIVQNGAIPTKHSMLDKLKLFNKDKTDRSSKTQVSKRTSSSSGFSSARSERSDSSLSLNDGPTNVGGKLLSSSKKCEILNGNKTKTKMLSASKTTTKEPSSSPKSKPEKKEKSPALNESTMPVNEAKAITPTKCKMELKPKPIVPATPKNMGGRSDSKNNLSQIQQPKSFIPAASGTSIPKPMAFIKGTTKPTLQLKPEHQSAAKSDKTVDISNVNISSSHEPQKSHLVAQLTINENTAHSNLSAAVHSMQQQIFNQSISMSDSTNSKSTHSSSTGIQSNSSDSSVIYRPSSESGSEAFYMKENVHHTHQPNSSSKTIVMSPNRKLELYTEPIVITENGRHKFNTVPSKMIHGTIFEEEKQMTVVPMRPLLRGYSSHVTLPTRGTRGQHLVSEYCEDIGQGYCSDGDALRKVPVRCSDIENGYMSEGGGPSTNGMHGKHMIGIMRTRTQLPTTFEER